jgi:antitoxin (DNA-binding transcriptional repressor) of toxin-antitoxin stability system
MRAIECKLGQVGQACYPRLVLHTFTIGEAKTQLSKLVALVESGEEVELRRGRTPVARLTPAPRPQAARKPGAYAGRIVLPEDFDAWPADIADALGIRD